MTARKKKKPATTKQRKPRPERAEGEARPARERAVPAEDSSSFDRTVPIIVGIVGAIAIGTWLWVTLSRDEAPEDEWAEVSAASDDDAPAGDSDEDPLATPPDVSAPPAGAPGSPSGLHWRILREGTGSRHPSRTDRVRVHYAGWRAEDGELFDSSYARNDPATFPLNGVIPGWTEVVQLMVEGEKRRVWIPARLAYEGRPGPQGMLVFDIELLAIL